MQDKLFRQFLNLARLALIIGTIVLPDISKAAELVEVEQLVNIKQRSEIIKSFTIGSHSNYEFICNEKSTSTFDGKASKPRHVSYKSRVTPEMYEHETIGYIFKLKRDGNNEIYASGGKIFGYQSLDDVGDAFTEDQVRYLKGVIKNTDFYNFSKETIIRNENILRKVLISPLLGGGHFIVQNWKITPLDLVRVSDRWLLRAKYEATGKLPMSNSAPLTMDLYGNFLIHLASGYVIGDTLFGQVTIKGKLFELGAEKICSVNGRSVSSVELGVGWVLEEKKKHERLAEEAAERAAEARRLAATKEAEHAAEVRRLAATKEAKRAAEARRLAATKVAERAAEARKQAAAKEAELEVAPTDEPMIAAKNANVRDRPGTDGAKVAYLQRGDEVTIVGRVRGLNWVEVARGGERLGFVFRPLLAERPATITQTASSSSITPAVSAKPVTTNKHAVAVILGNHDYGSPVPDVDYAANDADAMRRFVIEQLGYRVGNIIDLRDASQSALIATFGNRDDHRGKLWRLVRAGRSDVTVFYSGHGVPGLRNRKGYLLPVDADPDAVELNGYPLNDLLNNLAKLKTRSMTVYIDACFSGESPKGMLIQAVSGLSIEARMPTANTGMTVITAATGDQVASWDKKAKHGLFTKHLLDALAGAADKGDYGNGDGKVTVGEVKRYLDDEMTYAAQRNYGRVQSATIKGDANTVLAVVR